MLYIIASTPVEAAKQAFLRVLKEPSNSSDPSILAETAATIVINNTAKIKPAFRIIDQAFRYQESYAMYIPTIDPQLVVLEEEDYSRLLLKSGAIQSIVENLQQYPDSRRAVISSWSPQYLDPKNIGVCIAQLYFRLYNNKLVVHAHARANDAYRLLLLDMQLGISIQKEIASQLGVETGEYIHFMDSLHLYKKYFTEIERQREYCENSQVWQ